MKKTISIHIKGYPFNIEEIAYVRLENYLKRLTAALGKQKGAEEIIEDIELRIAELLTFQLNASKTIIEEKDVIEVLNTLGDPSDYADSSEEAEQEPQYNSYEKNNSQEKRLYRDVENSYIGGVCSGIGKYVGIDPTIIRLIWALFFFVGGMGFLLYIILWILLPKATSSIDRLRMQGKPINVDTVKEEVERATKNVADKSQKFAQQVRQNESIREGATVVGKILRVGLGAFFLFLATSGIVSILVFIFGATEVIPLSTEEGTLSLKEFSAMIFNNRGDSMLAFIAFFLTSISWIMFFLVLGLSLLFKLKNKFQVYIYIFLTMLFFAGVCCGIVAATRTTKYFSQSGELTTLVGKVDAKELHIDIDQYDAKSTDSLKIKTSSTWDFVIGKNYIKEYGVQLEYLTTTDSLFEIRTKREAYSNKTSDAANLASKITYNTKLTDSTLVLPNHFTFPRDNKLRAQNVKVLIYIPKGKTVRIGNEIIDLSKNPNQEEDEFYRRLDEENYSHQKGTIKANGTYRHRNY